MATMTIGKLAKSAGVGVETIRYYERSGFLPQPERLASGYRVYDGQAVNRVRFIKEAQLLGFTLSEITQLFGLTDDPSADCASVNKRAQEKLSEIDEKIRRLKSMRKSLKRLAEYCPADEQPLSECSIINHLYGTDNSSS